VALALDLGLGGGWKLIYFELGPKQSFKAGAGILVRPHLRGCVDEWISRGGRVHSAQICGGD